MPISRRKMFTRGAAAAAGSLFVFHGRHHAVLITYPPHAVRAELFSDPARSS